MTDNKKTPLFHLTKRGLLTPQKAWSIRIGSFVFAIFLGAVIFLCLGENPLSSYKYIVTGSLGSSVSLKGTVKDMIPLLGAALAIAPCFKMKFWNIGAEGQITFGAIGASWVAISLGKTGIPSVLLLLLMALAGAVFGGFWALIPAFFKSKWETNETLFTLMMNYIAIGLVKWLQGGPWEGKNGSQIIPMFDKKAYLPKILGVHCGWIIVLLLTVGIFVYMRYTKHGYEISVIGESVNTARYAGMNVSAITMRTMFLSGAICGIVGYLVVSGAHHTLYSDVAGGVGFTAITVAWLAQLNPFIMVIISAFLSILGKGANNLQTQLGVPTSVSDIITGIFLFSMLACEFFINYKMIFNVKKKEGGNNK